MPLYDLLIRGGEVIDPSAGSRATLDVAVANGRVAAIGADLPAEAERVVDARGRLIVPGLIDLHTHLGFEIHRQTIQADDMCPPSGVTTAVDMGSTGVYTFPWYRDRVIERSATRLFEFINISALGTIAIHEPYYVSYYGDYIDPDEVLCTIEENPEYICGIKVFASSQMVGDAALGAVRTAVQVGREAGLPVAVHVSARPPPVEEVLALLRPGDIMTHTYTPNSQTILDDEGRVRAGVREARERGVLFDLGHGFGSFSFEVARRAMDDDFLPDTISTDLYADNMVTPVKDLLTTASKFLCLGMPLEEVLARITIRPARALRASDLGALRVGGPADIALLRLCEGEHIYRDCRDGVLQGRQKLECDLTVCRGRILYQRDEG